MEVIGLIASILIVVSMVFKTSTFKGTMIMRIINNMGSIFFVIYGFGVGALATGICNAILLLINTYYIIKEYKDHQN